MVLAADLGTIAFDRFPETLQYRAGVTRAACAAVLSLTAACGRSEASALCVARGVSSSRSRSLRRSRRVAHACRGTRRRARDADGAHVLRRSRRVINGSAGSCTSARPLAPRTRDGVVATTVAHPSSDASRPRECCAWSRAGRVLAAARVDQRADLERPRRHDHHGSLVLTKVGLLAAALVAGRGTDPLRGARVPSAARARRRSRRDAVPAARPDHAHAIVLLFTRGEPVVRRRHATSRNRRRSRRSPGLPAEAARACCAVGRDHEDRGVDRSVRGRALFGARPPRDRCSWSRLQPLTRPACFSAAPR